MKLPYISKILAFIAFAFFSVSIYAQNKESSIAQTGFARSISDSAAFKYVYSVPERYVNDHSLIYSDSLWHLFYTDGSISAHPWTGTGNEINIEHAVSRDLENWTQKARALTVGPSGSLDDEHIYAPNVINANGKYYMFYTGNDRGFLDGEHIFMAESNNLYSWHRISGNPIFLPNLQYRVLYGMTPDSSVRPVSFRDPFVLTDETYGYICYYVCRLEGEDGNFDFACVAAATSPDLINWMDRGPVLTRLYMGYDAATSWSHPESPCVVKRDSMYYLFWKGGAGTRYAISKDPLNFHNRDSYFLSTSHASKVFEWNGEWFITSCSRWVQDASHTISDRTKGLFIARLKWDALHPEITPFSEYGKFLSVPEVMK